MFTKSAKCKNKLNPFLIYIVPQRYSKHAQGYANTNEFSHADGDSQAGWPDELTKKITQN
jgi:hypothetical protein